MMNCLIADNHWIVRMGLINFIQNHFENSIVNQASSIQQILEKLGSKTYDLILLGDSYNDGEIGNYIHDIRFHSGESKIIIISSSIRYFEFIKINEKVDAILSKEASQAAILNCIYNTIKYQKQNRCIFSSSNKMELLIRKINFLTKRELDVIRLLMKGYGNKEIVYTLNIKESTVSTLRRRALEKLDLNNNADLINLFSQSII